MFWLVYGIVVVVLIGLPTIIGLIRHVDHIGVVIAFSLLGIPTFMAGWLMAMLFACFWSRRPESMPMYEPASSPPEPRREYDPGPALGTPFENAARAGFWAEQPDTTQRRR